MDIDKILNSYPGSDATSNHPKMKLKILIYAYTHKTKTICRNQSKPTLQTLPALRV